MQVNEQIADRPAGSVVDIPRKKQPKTKRNVALAVAAVLVVGGITFGLSRLKAAAPTSTAAPSGPTRSSAARCSAR